MVDKHLLTLSHTHKSVRLWYEYGQFPVHVPVQACSTCNMRKHYLKPNGACCSNWVFVHFHWLPITFNRPGTTIVLSLHLSWSFTCVKCNKYRPYSQVTTALHLFWFKSSLPILVSLCAKRESAASQTFPSHNPHSKQKNPHLAKKAYKCSTFHFKRCRCALNVL